MSRRKKAGKKPSGTPRAAGSLDTGPKLREGPRESFKGVGVKIVAIALRRLEYSEVVQDAAVVQPPDNAKMDVKMDVEGTISLYEPDLGEFILDVTVRPDPARKPLAVRARISVLLKRDAQMTSEQLTAWINELGVLIVFPYVREAISNVTARGIFGPLYIDPISVDALIGRSEVQAQAAGR